MRFNLTTGMVSIAGNLVSMSVFAGAMGLDPVLANLVSICLCSLVNFLVCDQFVFFPRASLIEGTEPRKELGKAPRK